MLLAASSTFFVNYYHMLLTSKYRKLAGQKYPIAYASNELAEKDKNAYKFNCGKSCWHFISILRRSMGGCVQTGRVPRNRMRLSALPPMASHQRTLPLSNSGTPLTHLPTMIS